MYFLHRPKSLSPFCLRILFVRQIYTILWLMLRSAHGQHSFVQLSHLFHLSHTCTVHCTIRVQSIGKNQLDWLAFGGVGKLNLSTVQENVHKHICRKRFCTKLHGRHRSLLALLRQNIFSRNSSQVYTPSSKSVIIPQSDFI